MAKKSVLLCAILALLMPLTALAGEVRPKESHNRLSTRGAMRGSVFRITMIHPMRGDFSEYDRLEIVNTTTEVGDQIPAEEMEKYTENLLRSFQKAGIFKEVRRVDAAEFAKQPSTDATGHGQATPTIQPASLATGSPSSNRGTVLPGQGYRSPSAPIVASESDPKGAGPKRTMVIACQVIYYLKGSRAFRAIGFGGGFSQIVVRFHIYDKEMGQELAMGNISGEVNNSFMSVPLLAGDADGRQMAVSALVNRVEVRRAWADQ